MGVIGTRSVTLFRARGRAGPTDRSCHSLPPARWDRVAAAPDRPPVRTTASRRPDGAGWRSRRTDRPFERRPPAGPMRPGGGAADRPTVRATATRRPVLALRSPSNILVYRMTDLNKIYANKITLLTYWTLLGLLTTSWHIGHF